MMSSALWSLLKNRFPDPQLRSKLANCENPRLLRACTSIRPKRIGNEVIRSQRRERRDQFSGGAANGLMNLLRIQPPLQFLCLLGQGE